MARVFACWPTCSPVGALFISASHPILAHAVFAGQKGRLGNMSASSHLLTLPSHPILAGNVFGWLWSKGQGTHLHHLLASFMCHHVGTQRC